MLTREHKAITRKKVTAIYMGKRNLSQLNRGIHNSCGSNRLIIDDNLSEAQSIGDGNRKLFVTSQERKMGNFKLKNMS